MWVFLPVPGLYTIASSPSTLSGTITPFARVSPSGKLIVDVSGVASAVGVIEA
jgi:hypothetical protein